MDPVSGYASWVTWVVLIGGTAAFWAVIFVAVRALLGGRNDGVSPDAEHRRYPDSEEPP